MKYYSSLLLLFCVTIFSEVKAQAPERDFYELRLYHIEGEEQEDRMDKYLETALLPTLKKLDVEHIGVFKPVETDSAYGKAVYVFIPYLSVEEYLEVSRELLSDRTYLKAAENFLNSVHDNPPYKRMETMLLNAFEGMSQYRHTALQNNVSERIYELRSYESATENLFRNKVEMFNEGEVEIFERLGFNPIFFGEVVAGPKMPNLMYMTSHEDREAMQQNWGKFGSDEKWGEMSGMEKYQNNVSHIEIVLLHATEYSGI